MAHAQAHEKLDQFTDEESDLHGELLARNIFTVTMIGALFFFAACFKVMMF